jgi:hypothetical protein
MLQASKHNQSHGSILHDVKWLTGRACVLPIDLELDERVDGANGLMDEGSDDGSDQEDFVNGSDAGMYTDSRCAAAQYEAIYFITQVARVVLARLFGAALYLF